MTHALTEQLPVIDDRPTTQLTPVPGLDVPQWPPFDYDPPLRVGNCARLPNPFFRSARVEYPEPLTSSPCRPDPTTQKSPHTLNPTTAKSRRATGLFPFRAPGDRRPGPRVRGESRLSATSAPSRPSGAHHRSRRRAGTTDSESDEHHQQKHAPFNQPPLCTDTPTSPLPGPHSRPHVYAPYPEAVVLEQVGR